MVQGIDSPTLGIDDAGTRAQEEEACSRPHRCPPRLACPAFLLHVPPQGARVLPAKSFDARGAPGQALQPEPLNGVGGRGELFLGLDRHLSVVARCPRHLRGKPQPISRARALSPASGWTFISLTSQGHPQTSQISQA